MYDIGFLYQNNGNISKYMVRECLQSMRGVDISYSYWKDYKHLLTVNGAAIDDFVYVSNADMLLWNGKSQRSTRSPRRQLVVKADRALSHDGAIVNPDYLKEKYAITSIHPSTLILNLYNKTSDHRDQKWLEDVEGGNAFIMIDGSLRKVNVYRNFLPLYYIKEDSDFFMVTSDVNNIHRIFEIPVSHAVDYNIGEIPAYSWLTFHPQFNDVGNLKKIRSSFTSDLPETKKDHVLTALSGGIDSLVMAYVIKYIYKMKQTFVFYDYGQKSEEMESKAAERIASKLGERLVVFDLKELFSTGDRMLTDDKVPMITDPKVKTTSASWVAARDLFLNAHLVHLAESIGYKYVANGTILDDPLQLPDSAPGFEKSFNDLLNYSVIRDVKLIRPLQRLTKPEVIFVGVKLMVPFGLSTPCFDKGFATVDYKYGDPGFGYRKVSPCGVCSSCRSARYAFKEAGVTDPLKWYKDMPPTGIEQIKTNYNKLIEIIMKELK